LWTRGEKLGKEMASGLFEVGLEDVVVHEARVMRDGVNRPLKFDVEVGDLRTDIYWKPFIASRAIGNYLWNLLSGRTEHRFKVSQTGIIEQAARGKHEWEFPIEELETEAYRDERFRAFILATHVGIGDFAIKYHLDGDEEKPENHRYYWKASQYKVTDDLTVMPFDFDFLYLPDDVYHEQLNDLIEMDNYTVEQFKELHAQEDEGLSARYTLHADRLKDLVKTLKPRILAAYGEGKKAGKQSDEVIELFEFSKQLRKRIASHVEENK
jgi:hypothetical protein